MDLPISLWENARQIFDDGEILIFEVGGMPSGIFLVDFREGDVQNEWREAHFHTSTFFSSGRGNWDGKIVW